MAKRASRKDSDAALREEVVADIMKKCRVEILNAKITADFYDEVSAELQGAQPGTDDAKKATEYALKAQQRRDTIAFNERFLKFVQTSGHLPR